MTTDLLPIFSFATARLQARPLDEGDAELYCRLYCDPGLMRKIGAPFTRDAALRSAGVALRKQAPRPQRWIVADKATGSDVGLLGLIGEGDGPEIGVMLLADAHGRGLGTEAMAGLMYQAFTVAGIGVIHARQSVPDNPTVVRMMRGLGFDAVPPTPARPAGGDWILHRHQWLAAVKSRSLATTGVAG